jgi:pimeloyl-ACP methyl ester carboxylesterase
MKSGRVSRREFLPGIIAGLAAGRGSSLLSAQKKDPMMNAEPFEVQVSQTVLDDLKRRLAGTRWPDAIEGSGWEYGSNLAYMKELIDYWRTRFDWRAQEKRINSFAHFRARIDGLGIHFIHERGKGPNPMPLVLTHGWPSSFFEILKVVPLLTDPARYGGDPADSFDVIVPSLPGFGFSDRPTKPLITTRIHEMWLRLMTEALGYQRFGVHGGDIGAGVSALLGMSYPEKVIGVHSIGIFPDLRPDLPGLTEAEKTFIQGAQKWLEEEGGYSHIQRTRPQTLSYGLNDSPAGLAAWIVEKFRAWSDCDGNVEERFSKDELLTNITIYWASQTISSSIRWYFERVHNPAPLKRERITVPCAIAVFPKEIGPRPPRELGHRNYNVVRWTEMPRGGHFPALEEPELLSDDIRAFFRALRR